MRITTIYIILLISTAAHGQYTRVSEIIDSLKQEANGAVDLPSKFMATITIAIIYTYVNPDSTIKYGEQALVLAKKAGDNTNNEIWALATIGEAYIYKANLPKTVELALQAIDIGSKYDPKDLFIGPTYYNLSVTYYEIQDYDKALYYANKMIAIGGDPFGIDELSEAFGYYLVAMVQERLGKPDSALVNLAQSEALFKSSSGKSRYLGLAWIERVWPGLYNTRAKAHLQKGMHDEALKDLFWVLSNTEKNYEHFHSANTYNDIGLYYRTLGLRDSAVYYAEKGLEEANVIDYTQAQLAASKMLAEEYERKNPVKAIQYFKLANEFQNRLFGAGNVTIIREMIEKDEQRRQELADSEEEFRNRLRTNIFIGSSFTLFVITALVFWNSRQQRKSKMRIEIAYDRLKSTQAQLIQSEKMASLGELTAGIAHEIQNPLNFVNNFSEVNRELIEELKAERLKLKVKRDEKLEEEIINDLENNTEKINHHGKRADSIVKGMLQHSRTSKGEKELTDINSLCDEYLRLAYHGLRAKDKSFNADFRTELDPDLPKINIIPQDIGRVLLNLINNAFQAVAEVEKPEVIVSTKKHDKEIVISVADNGPGIPENIKDKIFQPFFTTKPTGEGTGLGLSLSYDIVKAHGGEIKVESNKSKGTTFILNLPVT